VKPDVQKRIETLAEKAIDDSLNEQETKELQELITQDEETALFYTQYMQQHAMLALDCDHIPEFKQVHISTNFPVSWIIAAAALLAVCFLLFKDTQAPKQEEIYAVIESTDFASWGDSTLPTSSGSELSAGKLKINEGLATLQFKSGAKVVLEGPATFEIIDSMTTRLHDGIVVSDIPESAHGFTIYTPTSKLVDHGTRFLTQVKNGGQKTILDVLEGEVELIKDNESQMFKTGQIAKSTDAGIEHYKDLREELFVKESGLKSVSSKEIKVTTAYGEGKDGTANGFDPNFHFNPGEIMIKHTDQYLRKGFAGFDLKFLDTSKVESIELNFNMVFSGFGSVALSRNSTFSIYGIIDDSQDNWPQGHIVLKNSPAYKKGITDIDLTKAVKLGEFKLPRGKITGHINFKSEELLKLIQTDRNKFITMAFICDTAPNVKRDNLVYSIAGKYHPTAQPPALHIIMKD